MTSYVPRDLYSESINLQTSYIITLKLYYLTQYDSEQISTISIFTCLQFVSLNSGLSFRDIHLMLGFVLKLEKSKADSTKDKKTE